MTDEQRTILACLPPNGSNATAAQIARTVGKPADHITSQLHRLKQAGCVAGNGVWWHRTRGQND